MSTQETMMKTLNQTLRTILLALAFIGTSTTTSAYDFKVNGIYYNKNGDKATVTYLYARLEGYSNGQGIYTYFSDYSGDVVIPETVTYNGNNYTVTSIGDRAFVDCAELTTVTIPETVTTISSNAFINCSGLSNITIPNSVTTIGDKAFYCCTGLTSVSIPNSVTTIGTSAFNGCHLVSIILGKSVSSIGASAIAWADYVTSLSEVPPTTGGSFGNFDAPLYVPLSSIESYETTYEWNYFTDVRGFGENYFSMPDVTTFHGETIVIPVTMENVDDITAFQTDLYLPEGFELVQDGDEYLVELSNRKGRDHVIMANEMPDGAIRVLSYSPTLKTFSGNEGELFYLTVKVPDDGDGNYRIELNNTIVTTIDEEEVHALNAANNIKVFAYTSGDVDASGAITVADIVQTARYILNYNPEPFIFDAADINGDGKITITDVVKIAHMVLDADYGEPTKSLISGNNSGDRMGGEMNQQSVAITLDNEQEYTAFQLDLTLPEGMTASDFALTERANELGLIVKDRGNGKIRVLGYTADLKAIKESEGALLTFNVTGAGEIQVDNIQLVTPEGQTVLLDGFTIGANNMTSVNELDSDKAVASVDYYNLTGQRIERPENGVTLVITTYTDGTRTTTKVIK